MKREPTCEHFPKLIKMIGGYSNERRSYDINGKKVEWNNKNKFCPLCGKPAQEVE